MLMKRTAIVCILFICSLLSTAQTQTDSCSMQISLLTVGPGTDLDALFGHTAIRVQDLKRGMDIVYNYGTFDDTDPLFYLRFMRGIMLYSVSVSTYHYFMEEYQYGHRSVVAQVLNLDCSEKNQLYESLRKNTLEENRYYQYHFHTDNCTTRAARIIEDNTHEPLQYGNVLLVNSSAGHPQGMSYRSMIHEYLDKQHAYWSEMGIDFLLGSNLDIYPTNTEAIHFLPDYLYRGMDSAHTGTRSMVSERQTLLTFPDTKITGSWFTPVAVFNFVFLASLLLYFLRLKRALLIFDISFFTLLGLTGILMAFMWLGRIDDVCAKNINILWALPTHIVAVFFIRKKAVWIKYYFLITAILAAGLLIGFPWWTQRMNTATLPVLGIILFRSFQLFQNQNHAEKPVVQK
jgi:hypothetical protein